MGEQELPLPSMEEKENWERQTTKPIAYNFGVLFNDCKKIACL